MEIFRAAASRAARWRWFAVVLCGVFSTAALAQAPDLDSLVAKKEYVEFERVLHAQAAALSPLERVYYEGLLANHLNQAQDSIRLLSAALPTLVAANSIRAEYAACTLADDYAKTFGYDDASRTYAVAAGIAQSAGRSSACEAARESARWRLFKGMPPQTISVQSTVTLQGMKDELGLIRIPVQAGNYNGLWLLDAGANLTVIRRSVAEKIGVQLSNGADFANGSGGLPVTVHAGIIPELHLGSAVVRNVPVLVADDGDLAFPGLAYEFDGSLGLPVLAAFGKVTYFPDARVLLGLAHPSAGGYPHNLFFERFTPLVKANLGQGDRLFTLDTGAQGTVLSAQFFAENQGAAGLGQRITLDLAGAGGTFTSVAYRSTNIIARFGQSCAKLPDAEILTTSTGLSGEFYGTIGQNALLSFSSVTLDFKNMRFSVTGGDCTTTTARSKGPSTSASLSIP